MRAIFQKKGKKGQNIRKFGQKCTKFENILKKGRDYGTHETARICLGITYLVYLPEVKKMAAT